LSLRDHETRLSWEKVAEPVPERLSRALALSVAKGGEGMRQESG
jgi:hypothetical protein